MKIALIYTSTTPELIDCINQEVIKQLGTGTKLITYQNPSVLADVRDNGYVTRKACTGLIQSYLTAIQEGADAILNICSSVGEVADCVQDMAKYIGVPIVRIDEDMCKEAVRLGSRIAVLATLPTTLEPTKNTILRVSRELGKQVSLVDGLINGAFGLEPEEFKRLLLEKTNELKDEVDVILLCQGSMAYCESYLQKATGKPVVSSPRFGAIALRKALEEKGLTNSPYAKVHPLSFQDVSWTHGFWYDVVKNNGEQTVPHLNSMFEAKDISHVIENFRICAGDSEGSFNGTNFGDGDFYKWMEAAMYTAADTNNQQLFKKLDDYINLIGHAQLSDGYISTKQILGEREQNGIARLGDINDFEVYNFGHLFTAACLYFRLTKKDNFLTIAKKAAGYLEEMYRQNAHAGEVQTAVCPSHYMGLIELYRTTGKKKYLDLAKLAIELRDSVKNGTDDNQDRVPLKDHESIVGHAVRSNYLYAGVADLYAENGDEDYQKMLDKVWRNLVDKKLYLTGGCGALYNGVSPYGNFFCDQKIHQAYGYEYQLPNITAYNETCASIGSVLWAYRMFQIDPKAEYFDVIERTMLNTNLASVSLDGKKYFYENMLRRTKKLDYELVWPLERTEYILSYCCPPNLARIVAQSCEYAYTVSNDTVWFGMYGSCRAHITLDNGASFLLIQDTEYPYDGRISLNFEETKNPAAFSLNLRIPSWAKSGYIEINGTKHPLGTKHSGTYHSVMIENAENTSVILYLDMPVRRTISHPLVEESFNQAALERGPLVYCIESPDSSAASLNDLWLDTDSCFVPTFYTIDKRSITALEGELYQIDRPDYKEGQLYQTLPLYNFKPTKVRFIPYFAWDNRGFGEMKIWLPLLLPYKKT